MGINIVYSSLLSRNGLFVRHMYNCLSFESYKVAACCCCNFSKVAKDNLTSEKRLNAGFSPISHVHRRFASSESNPTNKLPPLMDFPQLVWPSIIKSIRNFILTTFIVKPYLDRDFNFPDFLVGSKKAVEVRKCSVLCTANTLVIIGGFYKNIGG